MSVIPHSDPDWSSSKYRSTNATPGKAADASSATHVGSLASMIYPTASQTVWPDNNKYI